MGIGIREIDDDHRVLIDAINDLNDLALAKTPDKPKLAACLLHMIRHTRDHFEREEQLMANVRFPGIAKHKELHGAFAEAILAQAQLFVDKPDAVTARSVQAVLSGWVLSHVTSANRDIVPHLRARRVPVNAVRWTPDSR
ncbi:MAG: bacteriohemerythrin [Rhodospirillum sp.]|nr:bacteriohemerythrin [Rhodospirillum sp.]MCF8491677.1 bacteriohemerythrin [Rhodospirillum sp.]MCF8502935.1 bacteriohemerythrin [Rhodospirillum sp.]